jgi:MraZ protein
VWKAAEYPLPGSDGVGFFTGTYHHTIDQKGRVSIPAQFRRDGKSKRFMLCRGMETCLFLFPSEDFEKMLGRRFSDPPVIESRSMRNYQRILGPNSREVSPDKLGRITIPPELIKVGHLEKDVLILGAITWIEIWDPKLYRIFEGRHSFEDTAEEAFRWFNETRTEGA